MRRVPTCIVGGNNLFREGLKSLLGGTEYRPVALYRHIGDLDVIRPRQPKMFLIGLDPADKDETAALRVVRERYADSRTVAITPAISRRQFADCFSAGMDGYLAIDEAAQILVQALRLITRGVQVFPTMLVAGILAKDFAADQEAAVSDLAGEEQRLLSRREQEVLALLMNGASNKAIASRLNIEDCTVKAHLRKILKKIPAANRTQAAVWAAANLQGSPAHV